MRKMESTQKLSNTFLYAALAGGRTISKSAWAQLTVANRNFVNGWGYAGIR